MAILMLKAFLLGIMAAVPPGPVCLLVMQKTLTKGRLAGFVTGMGSMLVDTMYALLSFVAIGMVLDIIHLYEGPILLGGGAIVAVVGINMFTKKADTDLHGDTSKTSMLGYAAQCAGCALANPGAIAMILSLVALLGINADVHDFSLWAMLPLVAAGELTYWFFYTWAVRKLRRALAAHSLVWVNRIMGGLIVVLGIVLLVKGIIMI